MWYVIVAIVFFVAGWLIGKFWRPKKIEAVVNAIKED